MSENKVPFMAAAKFTVIGLLIGGVLGGAGAGYVWWNDQQAIAAANTAKEEGIQAADEALEAERSRMAELETRAARLEARAEVARALDELDRRNFGNVGEHLQAAAGKLEGDPAKAAAELRGALGQVDIDPGADLETIRTTLRGLAAKVDGLLQG